MADTSRPDPASLAHARPGHARRVSEQLDVWAREDKLMVKRYERAFERAKEAASRASLEETSARELTMLRDQWLMVVRRLWDLSERIQARAFHGGRPQGKGDA